MNSESYEDYDNNDKVDHNITLQQPNEYTPGTKVDVDAIFETIENF